MRILVVGGDLKATAAMQHSLKHAGYAVEAAYDGEAGYELAVEREFGLVILDSLLRKIDGWTICDRLRQERSRVPVLMLTAGGKVDDRVRALDLGADDCLAQPFDMKELLARVRSLLRRDKMHRARIIRIADLVIDTAQHLVSRGDEPVQLSIKEYELLEALAAHESRVLTREVIQDRIWMDEKTCSNTVDVYINTLRKKIDAGHGVKLIQTVRGVGYTLRADTLTSQPG